MAKVPLKSNNTYIKLSSAPAPAVAVVAAPARNSIKPQQQKPPGGCPHFNANFKREVGPFVDESGKAMVIDMRKLNPEPAANKRKSAPPGPGAAAALPPSRPPAAAAAAALAKPAPAPGKTDNVSGNTEEDEDDDDEETEVDSDEDDEDESSAGGNSSGNKKIEVTKPVPPVVAVTVAAHKNPGRASVPPPVNKLKLPEPRLLVAADSSSSVVVVKKPRLVTEGDEGDEESEDEDDSSSITSSVVSRVSQMKKKDDQPPVQANDEGRLHMEKYCKENPDFLEEFVLRHVSLATVECWCQKMTCCRQSSIKQESQQPQPQHADDQRKLSVNSEPKPVQEPTGKGKCTEKGDESSSSACPPNPILQVTFDEKGIVKVMKPEELTTFKTKFGIDLTTLECCCPPTLVKACDCFPHHREREPNPAAAVQYLSRLPNYKRQQLLQRFRTPSIHYYNNCRPQVALPPLRSARPCHLCAPSHCPHCCICDHPSHPPRPPSTNCRQQPCQPERGCTTGDHQKRSICSDAHSKNKNAHCTDLERHESEYKSCFKNHYQNSAPRGQN